MQGAVVPLLWLDDNKSHFFADSDVGKANFSVALVDIAG